MIDWAQLVRDEGPSVWQSAFRLVGDRADAEDCVQEAFAHALEISRREPVTSWAGLLRRLVIVQGLQRLRERYAKGGRPFPLPIDVELASSDANPVEMAQTSELAACLRQALTQLPHQEATVFCLCSLEGRSYQEVAGLLDLETSTVGVILHRTRARLRVSLAAFFEC